MPSTIEAAIDCEKQLRLAMISEDVDALDDLICDDLIFTGPIGNVMTKQDDLAAHRSRVLCIHSLDLFETRFQPVENMVIATAKANLTGLFDGMPISGVFAYTRLWRSVENGWRVQAGHCSQIGDI
ncbi:nuclear transport factor 2 family protein [Ochrobactrum sp. Marseille-Q0166]|uniref:nuclear transport factor 2 family protein n=1 Tax=Ochrobactrum sp. Marseille-Q0166 TaxID=2761105 RepID=UPI001655247E|nr:nuclear transport factor 2 family protein [Ochrobactrum sp. Marseille-Q0166]MBC8716545.1 nuclear transport factor 2 family protein [Ochrobactrum sp. Marseille-Q0166]